MSLAFSISATIHGSEPNPILTTLKSSVIELYPTPIPCNMNLSPINGGENLRYSFMAGIMTYVSLTLVIIQIDYPIAMITKSP